MTDHATSIKEARRRLHEIVRKDVSFDEKARDALELARQCLEVDDGLVTRVDTETDHWEVLTATDAADGQLSPGEEQELEKTYCRNTIEDDDPLVLHDAPNQGWADDPVLDVHDHHTYLGAPLIIDGETYGTVCFVAEEPHSEPFSDAETRFVEHLTRLLERELARKQVEAELTNQTNLAAVLNRVLRHNLRNDVTVARGYTQQIAGAPEDEPAVEPVLDHLDALIDVSEQARELERIVTSDAEPRPTPVDQLVEDIVGTVAQAHPAASISVEYDNGVSAPLRPHFDRAIEELLQTTIENSGERPVISVTIDAVPNAVEIRIADDGSGLSEQELEVLATGEETPLTHGSGLELWLVHWIVSNHNGSIDPTVTQQETTITISIPRTPRSSIEPQLPDITRGRDRFQAAFEQAHDAIVLLNDEGRILNTNAAAETLFGLDSEELLGRPFADFTSDEFDFDAEWRAFQTSGTTLGTVTITAADGEKRIIEYSGKTDIVPGEHVFVGRNITDRKERERELRRAKRRLSVALEAANAGVWEWDIQTGSVVWDETMERILGLEPGSFEGTVDAFLQRVHPDDRADLEATVEATIEGDGTTQWEVRLVHEDGGFRWFDTRVQVSTDPDGTPRRMVGVGIDITDRKEREQELTQTRQMLEEAQHMSDLASFEFDIETGQLRRHSGISGLEDLTPGHLATVDTALEHVHPDDRDRVRTRIQEIIETSGDYDIEFRVVYGEETVRWYHSRADVVSDDGTAVLRGMIQDITERTERERRYNAIFNQTYQFTGLLEPDGTVLEANDSALDFGDLSREDVVGKPFWDVDWWQIDERTQQRLRDAIDRAAAGEFVRYEVEVQGSEGTAVIDFSIRPITDDDGNVTLLVPEGRDITARKERERELTAVKQRYETLLERAPDPVFVADAETGEIIEVNEAATRLIGTSRDRIVGKHQTTLHPAEDAELYRNTFRQIEGARTTVRTLSDCSRPELVTADGEHIPIEISVDTVSLDDGAVIYGIFREVSESDDCTKTPM